MTGKGRGFTLLEILVVIALLGLMSMVLIGGTGRLLESKDRDPENLALGAIAQARQNAVQAGRTVELRADQIGKDNQSPAPKEKRVRFLPTELEAASLVGGRLTEEALPAVRFYADGTCDPFRLEINDRDATRALIVDPWTCTVFSPDKASSRP